jgi:hypothetical protein
VKRDMDLVREILLKVEATPPQELGGKFRMPSQNGPIVMEHLAMLIDEGFLDGKALRADQSNAPVTVVVTRLTWKGHDFLDAARDDNNWHKAKRTIAEKGGSFTMEILVELLKSFAKAQLGLA